MNEGPRQQEKRNEAAHHALFVYSKPENKSVFYYRNFCYASYNRKESHRVPFFRNPKPPLYESR